MITLQHITLAICLLALTACGGGESDRLYKEVMGGMEPEILLGMKPEKLFE